MRRTPLLLAAIGLSLSCNQSEAPSVSLNKEQNP